MIVADEKAKKRMASYSTSKYLDIKKNTWEGAFLHTDSLCTCVEVQWLNIKNAQNFPCSLYLKTITTLKTITAFLSIFITLSLSPFVHLFYLSLSHSFFHLLSSYFSFLSFTLFSRLFQNILLSNGNCFLILVFFGIFKQVYQVSFSFFVVIGSHLGRCLI